MSVSDARAEADRIEEVWVAASRMDSYKQIGLIRKSIGVSGAELEYTYVDPTGEPMHGMNRYIATPKRFYTIYWVATQSDWEAQVDNWVNLTAGFQPAP